LKRPSAVFLLLVMLTCAGCLELVRRPSPKGYSDTRTPSYAGDKAAETPSKPVAQLNPEPIKGIERSKKQRRTIQQVNEYALWCIENEMWNEARTHMERAIVEDSLSASLHNNLAIVYEHLGKADRASAYYQRALDLNPAQEAYRSNLDNLRNRQQALADTASDFELFRMPERDETRRTGGFDDRAVSPFSQESE
jgi:tetratricopeptide (TPR) repeat protein